MIGLIGSYIGIYFYLRVIQLMFMSAGEAAATERPSHGLARSAGMLCLAATLLLAILPGWVIGKF